ncbi:hypothetical protein K474DRAFT_1662102 [Panus rudis PR-1116 ss-1]|nr:hypothetical protein K474DRAFT_1662102 [Panus rudis PR-1116 ss-1]
MCVVMIVFICLVPIPVCLEHLVKFRLVLNNLKCFFYMVSEKSAARHGTSFRHEFYTVVKYTI